jgi:glucose-fructose oxidoreductase
MSKTYRFAGVNFDHMHMGDLLRLVHEHPNAEIAGIADADASRMQSTADKFNIPAERIYTDFISVCKKPNPMW